MRKQIKTKSIDKQIVIELVIIDMDFCFYFAANEYSYYTGILMIIN